uniref:Iron-sulfur cluster biosynthesis family protein n=1 Tax=Salix viminalis TaxID=40686 RepID=A0A6N2LEJ6_SALVM
MASISARLLYFPSIFTSIPPIRLKPPDSLILKTQTLHKLSFKSPSPKTPIGFSVKATSDVTKIMGIRPGGVVETDKLPSDVRNRAMEAVDACGGRVTIGDVASRAGLKLNESQKALQALASDTDGFLEVSDEGDVLYVFSKDYRSKLAAKSLRLKLEPLFEKGKAAAEYVIRVSFGTALIASIVIVYTTIIAILSSSREENDRGRRRSRSFDSGFSFFFSPTDLFWYWDPYYYRRRQLKTNGGDNMNFIESVFSFVFGDGDPNLGIEEDRWKLIGQYISSNGGVVAAEELAPFLDLKNTEDMSDESYILPVLLRFDGQPEIDEERTASSKRSGRKEYVGRQWTDWVGGVEKFFREKTWQFSKTSASERAMAIGLGGLNLFGVIILGTMLQDMTMTQNGGFIKFVSSIFPLLQIYAGSFFAIPLIRWFLVLQRNAKIEKRNTAREQCAKMLGLPDLSLRRKILSARDMARKTVIGQDRIVYTTDKDIIEQDVEAQEWDQRFREIKKSD